MEAMDWYRTDWTCCDSRYCPLTCITWDKKKSEVLSLALNRFWEGLFLRLLIFLFLEFFRAVFIHGGTRDF